MSAGLPSSTEPSGAPGQAALSPWLQRQLQQLLAQRGHAWLLQGPSGLGQYPLALALAAAWLCEQPSPQGACGLCSSCHAVAVRTHADLALLMPETHMLQLGWPLPEKAQDELDKKSRKPSKDIRIDALRDVIEFAQRTDARGRGKVVLVYPAERMNGVSANALLKTLEEPVGQVRFVLATEAAHALLPTIRSRCLSHTLAWPEGGEGALWLQAQGLDGPVAHALMRSAGQRPDDVMGQLALGMDAAWWQALPAAMRAGQVAHLSALSPAQAVGALQKLCHDAMLVQVGAVPRFFDPERLRADVGAGRSSLRALSDWFKRLAQAARTAEHPFNAGLMLEALADDAMRTLAAQKPDARGSA